MNKQKNTLTLILAFLIFGIGTTMSLSSFKESTTTFYAETGTDPNGTDSGEPPLFAKSLGHSNHNCQAQTVSYTQHYNGSILVYTSYSNGKIEGVIKFGQIITHTVTGSTTIASFVTGWVECLAVLGLGCTPCPPTVACTVGCTI